MPLLGDQPVDLALGLVLRGADDPDLRPQRLDALDLVARHQARHADDAASAGLLCGIGEAAAVVAGRDADHAFGLLLGRERQHRVGGAAQLEAAGDLAGARA